MSTRFYNAFINDGETEVVVEFDYSPGEDASYSYGGAGSAFDTSGCAPEVSIVDCWLKSDEDRADAPSVTLTDADRERIEIQIAEDPDWQDCGDYDDY